IGRRDGAFADFVLILRKVPIIVVENGLRRNPVAKTCSAGRTSGHVISVDRARALEVCKALAEEHLAVQSATHWARTLQSVLTHRASHPRPAGKGRGFIPAGEGGMQGMSSPG